MARLGDAADATRYGPPNPGDRVLPFTRFVLTFELIVLAPPLLALALAPEDTDRFFAWTIAKPMSAAFLAAAFIAAVIMSVWALTAREWRVARPRLMGGSLVTSLLLVITLRDLGSFHLGTGSFTARAAGWIWLIDYLVLPVLNVGAVLLQYRAGVSRSTVRQPLLGTTRVAFAVYGLVLTVVGTLLLFAVGTIDGVWPWPVNRLSAGAIGAWLLPGGLALLGGLREGDWEALRPLGPYLIVFFGLLLVGAARFGDDFVRDGTTWAYVGAVALSLGVFAVITWRQERARTA